MGYTGEQLAEKCAISANYLRQIESGAKCPSLALFVDLCNVLDVPASHLFRDVCQTMEVSQELFIGQLIKVDDLCETPMRRLAMELLRFIWDTVAPADRMEALADTMDLIEKMVLASETNKQRPVIQ